jgi:hypothetical protein
LPEALIWIRRTQVYRTLLKYHAGKIRNRANLKRAAQCCGIPLPLSIPIPEIYIRLQICISQCDYFHKHGQSYCRKHLSRRLSEARAREDEEAEQQILAIIQKEKDRSFWRRLNHALGKPRGSSCFRVEVDQGDGTLDEYTSQHKVHQAIWKNIHNLQFHLAEEAPICLGQLRGNFGYNTITPTASAILAGSYTFPPDFN